MKTIHNGHFWVFECPGCNCCHYADDRWTFNGDAESPTFSPSIFVNSDGSNPTVPRCHSFVRNGKIEFLNDCTHELAGQTVDMVDI